MEDNSKPADDEAADAQENSGADGDGQQLDQEEAEQGDIAEVNSAVLEAVNDTEEGGAAGGEPAPGGPSRNVSMQQSMRQQQSMKQDRPSAPGGPQPPEGQSPAGPARQASRKPPAAPSPGGDGSAPVGATSQRQRQQSIKQQQSVKQQQSMKQQQSVKQQSPGKSTGIPRGAAAAAGAPATGAPADVSFGSKPGGRRGAASASPSRIPRKVPPPAGDWNPYTIKSDDLSLALKNPSPARSNSPGRSGAEGEAGAGGGEGTIGRRSASGGKVKSSANVSSPTREEALKRRQWAEAAQRRKEEAARRLAEQNAKAMAEYESRIEMRRQMVRKRIQEEKEAQERIQARRAAPPAAENVDPLPSPTRTRGRNSAGRYRPGAESAGEGQEDGGYVPPSKRAGSPRPLYLRLQEEFERKQLAEAEEYRKKVEAISKAAHIRTAALMAGEVIIKPPPGEGAEAVRSRESPPRWWYTYQNQLNGGQSPTQQRSISPREGGELAGEASGKSVGAHHAVSGGGGQGDGRHVAHVQRAGDGSYLYSMHEHDGSGEGDSSPGLGGGNASQKRRGQLNMKREPAHHTPGAERRFTGVSKRYAGTTVDRGCSPIQVDPATGEPLNIPEQSEFWNRGKTDGGANGSGGGAEADAASNGAAAVPPSPRNVVGPLNNQVSLGGASLSSGKMSQRLGALEQPPPAPPTSRIQQRAEAKAKAAEERKAARAAAGGGEAADMVPPTEESSLAGDGEEEEGMDGDADGDGPTTEQLEQVLDRDSAARQQQQQQRTSADASPSPAAEGDGQGEGGEGGGGEEEAARISETGLTTGQSTPVEGEEQLEAQVGEEGAAAAGDEHQDQLEVPPPGGEGGEGGDPGELDATQEGGQGPGEEGGEQEAAGQEGAQGPGGEEGAAPAEGESPADGEDNKA